MFKDFMKISGDLNICVYDKNGKLKESHVEKNLIVNTGLNYICSRIKDDSVNPMEYMAVGSGNVAQAAGDIALGSEEYRKVVTSIVVTDNSVTYLAIFSPNEGTGAITEAGIFNAAEDGTMLSRVTFPVTNKEADDTMSITWVITVQV